jgi:hypothetical protein
MTPFEIRDCTLLTQMSGVPAAVNLRELRDRIAVCSHNVIYHHFCETLLVPLFDYPDYRNDFAVWAKRQLDDDVLAERLGIIDPYAYSSIEELRLATLDIIEERLSEHSFVPWAHPGYEFYFLEATTIVFDTGQRINHPDELAATISGMTNSSIYFHFLEARRRPPLGVDDFSAWLINEGKEWEHYIQALGSVDIAFNSLAELRKELVKIL